MAPPPNKLSLHAKQFDGKTKERQCCARFYGGYCSLWPNRTARSLSRAWPSLLRAHNHIGGATAVPLHHKKCLLCSVLIYIVLDHAVYREDKSSTKVRIVWNAAAQFKGVSLNEGFHKGADLLNSLISCLLAWRRDRVSLVGDVKKMFNQIVVADSDQIYHRFVWRFGDECVPPTAFQWIRLLWCVW